MDLARLDILKYSELQKLAKEAKVKANLKSDKLIKLLQEHYADQAKQSTDQPSQVVSTIHAAVNSPPASHSPSPSKITAVVKSPAKNSAASLTCTAKQSKAVKPVAKSSPAVKTLAMTSLSLPHSPAKRTPAVNPLTKNDTPNSKKRSTAIAKPACSPAHINKSKSVLPNSAKNTTPTRTKRNHDSMNSLTNSGVLNDSLKVCENSMSGSPLPKHPRRSTFELTPNTTASDKPSTDSKQVPAWPPASGASPHTKAMISSMTATMDSDTMKQTLINAIDKKAAKQMADRTDGAEGATQIPRFMTFLNKRNANNAKPSTPGSKKWEKIHARNFDKMDSLDVYLDKKRKRKSELLSSIKKAQQVASEARSALNNIKVPHTPNATQVIAKKSTPMKAAKSFLFRSPAVVLPKPATTLFKPVLSTRNMNLDFAQIKSPVTKQKGKQLSKTAPRPVTRKSPRNADVANQSLVFGAVTGSVTKPYTPAAAVLTRKSLGGEKSALKPRKSVSTPFNFTFSAANMSHLLNETQSVKKFDINASLARPLTWVPHKGKLKSFSEYTLAKSSAMKGAAKTVSPSGLKHKRAIKTPPIKSKADRRAAMVKQRAVKKSTQQMKRRGIIG